MAQTIEDRPALGRPAVSAAPKGRSVLAEDRWLIVLFLLPTTLFMVLLLWLPFLQGIWMSLHNWPFMGEPSWRGLQNYVDFLDADYFWVSIESTLIYSLSTLFQLIVALTAALALKQRFVPLKLCCAAS